MKGVIIGLTLAVVVLVGFLSISSPKAVLAGEATMYKSPGCGCCGGFASHMNAMGVQMQVIEGESPMHNKVPSAMRSCHSTMMGKYIIEGHMPQEAIQKLMDEQPDIEGIALPGMPAGSPGMPGQKQGKWTVHAIHHDGSTSEFMQI